MFWPGGARWCRFSFRAASLPFLVYAKMADLETLGAKTLLQEHPAIRVWWSQAEVPQASLDPHSWAPWKTEPSGTRNGKRGCNPGGDHEWRFFLCLARGGLKGVLPILLGGGQEKEYSLLKYECCFVFCLLKTQWICSRCPQG